MKPKVSLIDFRDMRISPDTEYLGLAYLAAFLREHKITVTLSALDSAQDIARQLRSLEQETTIYGFSIFHVNYDIVSQAADLIKAHNANSFIVVGGFFATEYAALILADIPAIDGVVTGYGEMPLLQLVNSYPNRALLSAIPNLITRDHGDENKDRQMVSSKPNLERWAARDFIVQSSRRPSAIAHLIRKVGCSHRCSFCLTNNPGNHALKKIALRSTEDILAEITSLNKRYGFRIFMFHDCPLDDYGKQGLKQLEELCDRLADDSHPYAFECMINGRNFANNNASIIGKMRKAGFSQVLFLLGSGNDGDIEIIKNQTGIVQMEILITAFQNNDIEVMLEFFMLNPLSTLNSIRDNYAFLLRMKSYRLGDFMRKVPAYAGTPLFRIAKDRGLLREQYSYKYPYEYDYLHDYLQEVDHFFGSLSRESTIMIEDYRFQNLVYLTNWLKVLFPETLFPYLNDIQSIKSALHDMIQDYLKSIFINCSILDAQRQLADFTQAMEALYKKATSLQFKIFRESDVKNYLLKR